MSSLGCDRLGKQPIELMPGLVTAGIGEPLQFKQVMRINRAPSQQLAGVLRTFIEEVAEFLQVAARVGQVRQAIQCLLIAFVGQGAQGFSI